MQAPINSVSTLRELEQRMLARMVQRFRVVQIVVGPALFAIAAAIVIADGTPWRMAVVGIIGPLFGLAFVALRKRPETVYRAKQSTTGVAALITFQMAIVFASGGLVSPLLPVVFVPAFLSALFGRRRVARMVVLAQILLIWVFFGLHLLPQLDLVPVPLRAGREPLGFWALLLAAATMDVALGIAYMMGTRARASVNEHLFAVLRARDVALSNYAERNQELTTLSGEIAHELKNPLASVKGLAALIGKDLRGKPAERLGVLRREVDRMQEILEEFLNFSRPLAPLTLRRVSLTQLAEQVVELHEGIAHEARVHLAIRAKGAPTVQCDPRKIQQILVNLVQNAIDASPEDGHVDVVIEGGAHVVTIDVVDDGEGVDPGVADRIFDAGVTTKETGNGLGLPMARALAEQHGGELELGPRADGRPGCRAHVVLPIEVEPRANEPNERNEPNEPSDEHPAVAEVAS